MDHDTVEMAYVVFLGPICGTMLVGSTCWHWGNSMDMG